MSGIDGRNGGMADVSEAVALPAVRATVSARLAAAADVVEQRRLRALETALAGDDPTFSAYLTFRLERRQPGTLAALARLLGDEGQLHAAAAYALDAAAAHNGDPASCAEMADLAKGHAPADLIFGLAAGVLQDPAAPKQARQRAAEHVRGPRLAAAPIAGRPSQTYAEALRRRLQDRAPQERDALRLGVLAAGAAARDTHRVLPDLRLLAGLSYWSVLAFVIDQAGPLESARRTALRRAAIGLHARNLKLFGDALEQLPPAWIEPLDAASAGRPLAEADVSRLATRALEARRAREPRFVLISGTMRSGTTLLTNLLYSAEGERPRHPAIAVTPDSIDLLRRLGVAERGAAANPQRLDLAVERRQTGASARTAALLRTALLGRIAFDAPTVAAPAIVGFKSTALTSEFDRARECFADARMVLCVRDPRDVAASNNLRHFGARPRADSLTILAHLLDSMALAAEGRRDVHVVRYEDVVRDTEGEVRRLLRFLDADEAAYDWGSLRAGLSDNSSYRQGGRLSEAGHGVSGDSVGRWRENLSPVEAELVTAVLGPDMVRMGYVEVAPELSGEALRWARQVMPDVLGACGKFGTDAARLQARAAALGLIGQG